MKLADDFSLASKFLRFRLLSTVLTVMSVALGVSLMIWLQNVTKGVREAFVQHATPYNLLVGGVGSPVQLVLSGLFYLDKPVGNIPRGVYQDMKDDPRIERAVPIALGDSFRGVPVVGTTPEFFQPLPGEKFPLRIEAGKIFGMDFESVVGAEAARSLSLRLGSTFQTSHGLSGNASHAAPYAVVGILSPTGGPRDRAIYCSLESVRRVHREELAPTDAPTFDLGVAEEVTAVLVRPRQLTDLPLLQRKINLQGRAQAIFPAAALYQLFDIMDIWKKIIEVLCWIVVGVALTTISISLYSFVEDRKDEIALMRALGASRGRVTRLILLQSEMLAAGGAVAGIVLGHLLMVLLGDFVRHFTGVELSWRTWTAWEGIVFGVLLVTGAVFGLLPAWKAYRVSVADHLA